MSGSLWKNIKILILIQMPARQGKVFCFHYSIQCCRTPMPSCEFLWPHNGWITPTTAQIYATWNIFPTYLQNTENISNLASDTRWKYLQAQQFHVSNRIFFHFHYCNYEPDTITRQDRSPHTWLSAAWLPPHQQGACSCHTSLTHPYLRTSQTPRTWRIHQTLRSSARRGENRLRIRGILLPQDETAHPGKRTAHNESRQKTSLKLPNATISQVIMISCWKSTHATCMPIRTFCCAYSVTSTA